MLISVVPITCAYVDTQFSSKVSLWYGQKVVVDKFPEALGQSRLFTFHGYLCDGSVGDRAPSLREMQEKFKKNSCSKSVFLFQALASSIVAIVYLGNERAYRRQYQNLTRDL